MLPVPKTRHIWDFLRPGSEILKTVASKNTYHTSIPFYALSQNPVGGKNLIFRRPATRWQCAWELRKRVFFNCIYKKISSKIVSLIFTFGSTFLGQNKSFFVIFWQWWTQQCSIRRFCMYNSLKQSHWASLASAARLDGRLRGRTAKRADYLTIYNGKYCLLWKGKDPLNIWENKHCHFYCKFIKGVISTI